MQTLAEIKALLDERGLSPKKALGQNFLTDHNLIRKLTDAARLSPADLVLEVGPGTGTLTEHLLEQGCTVVACELDDKLAQLNRERLGPRYPDTFTLVHADCLASKRALNPELLDALSSQSSVATSGGGGGGGGSGGGFKLVANLPYACATPLLLALLTRHPECRAMHVTIQKEVADRLAATPATPSAYGVISVVAQALATVSHIATLPRECFWPRPDVTSAMISIVRDPDPIAGPDPAFWPIFADLVQNLFQTRRKQLSSTLKRLGTPLASYPPGIEPTDRPEALHPDAFVALARALRR
ncbi:MAG: 16S rRNA (adenine(1518)-N(6)/adenine(1519)-N(6))-dimethyltransferase RsmA [Phycisphaerales bacterium JB040]